MMKLKNIFTCDVEDYFQVESFARQIKREDWSRYPLRVVENTRKVLRILREYNVQGTFFVLGWIAERCPELVQEIDREGHEVACHGYGHGLVFEQTRREFIEDVKRSKEILEKIVGKPVVGYRAPSYSITGKSLWALDELFKMGFLYDSSIFPIHHDRYGIPHAPRFIHSIELSDGKIWECPPSTVRFAKVNFPVAGGGYFRIFPLRIILWGLQRIQKEGKPVVFYIHPWEFDPDQPRIASSRLSTFRHYFHLEKTESRLKTLLEKFSFTSFREYFSKL